MAEAGRGWELWTMKASIGCVVFQHGQVHKRRGAGGNDPQDARALEWVTTSPPPSMTLRSGQSPIADDHWGGPKHPEDPDSKYE